MREKFISRGHTQDGAIFTKVLSRDGKVEKFVDLGTLKDFQTDFITPYKSIPYIRNRMMVSKRR